MIWQGTLTAPAHTAALSPNMLAGADHDSLRAPGSQLLLALFVLGALCNALHLSFRDQGQKRSSLLSLAFLCACLQKAKLFLIPLELPHAKPRATQSFAQNSVFYLFPKLQARES